jgi:PAS domain S-box-containing protein
MSGKYPETKNIKIPEETLLKWQNIVNTMAETINVPAALIMRLDPPQIEVLRASDKAENPYEVGDTEKLLGLYCEEVIRTDTELIVADARESEKWKNSPDVGLGMVSYFGVPLKWPDGDIFGTICVLDSKKNEYSDLFRKLMVQFKGLVESHLELIFNRKEIEREKEKIESYLDAVGLLVVILDKEGLVKRINERGCDILGQSKEEIEGKNWFENFIPEGIREEVKDVFNSLLSGDIDKVEDKENPVIVDGDKEKMIAWHNNIIKNVKGEIVGIINSGIDLTERKKAEEELKETKERYQKIVENADEWIWILDRDGNFIYANRAALENSGYKYEKWLGRNFGPIVVEEDLSKVKKIFAETLGGKSQHYELRIKDKKGNIRIMQVNTAPLLEDEEVVGTISVGRDVTEVKEKEKEFRKMDKLESLGVLAGGIAHDFNNLLIGIMGNISLAKMNIIDEETKEILSEAEKASKKASRLTDQLLTFSKGGEPIKEKTSIEDVIRESAGFVLHGSNVKCKYDFPEDLWKVKVDKGQISQVVNNIVLNADQAMPEGGKISIKVENLVLGQENTLSFPEGNYIKITIEDEGIGIPEEHLDKIFDPYFSTKLKGHGLGMTTVYSIVQKHKGHIKVESKSGKGTTFYVYLPAAEGEGKEKEGEEKEKEEKETLPLEKQKILLMDDEGIVRKTIGRMLTDRGSEVVFAEDGVEALKKFREAKNSPHPFDAVILDLTIPGGMGGKETVKKIREMDSNVKIIVASGYSNDPVMANYEKYGFNGVLAKPFHIEELVKILKSIIGKS